jgi:CheY-like chemotaxis protein
MIMKKLLLIDDDAFLRDMYATKFAASDYAVDTAESAAAALSKLQQSPDYDVILLDMIMPAMTGTELITEIREKHPEVTAPCIVLSNQGQSEDVAAAKAAGAAGYIIKAEAVPSDVVKTVTELIST